jgi:hypothetical protein
MASSDLDPLFLKALKLLQSRSKESRDQLRQLYDEIVAQRRAELDAKRVRFCALVIFLRSHKTAIVHCLSHISLHCSVY